MTRRRRPDLSRRSQSYVRRATSRANQTDQENNHIALVNDNEIDRLRIRV